jgi:hypothetical protein
MQKQIREQIKLLLIEAFADYVTENTFRTFGSDMSDITLKWTEKFEQLLSQQRQQDIEKIDYRLKTFMWDASKDVFENRRLLNEYVIKELI